MPPTQIIVRPAEVKDAQEIEHFFRHVRRRYITFGMEDLPQLIREGLVFVAKTGGLIWGVLAVSPKDAGEWGHIRGVGIIDGWQARAGVGLLLYGARSHLRNRGVRALYIILTEEWLHGPLHAHGFVQASRLGTYLRHAHSIPPVPRDPAALRLVRPDDIPQVAQVDRAAFAPLWSYSARELTYLLALGCRMVVAEMDGRIVGYACGEVIGDIGHIARLAVHPDRQGQGIGRQLLLDTMTYLHSVGVTRFSLNTEIDNPQATRLYESLNFRRFGRLIPVLVKDIGEK